MEKETLYLIEYTGWHNPLWFNGSTFTRELDEALKFSDLRKAEKYMDERVQLKEAVITEHIFEVIDADSSQEIPLAVQ